MFHIECTCPTIATGPTTNKLDRCHRCHGYEIQGTIPDMATCRQCRKPASTACAVCLICIHRLGGCMVGYGANRAYDQLPDEQVSVRPDCPWKCVEFISKDPCKDYTEQEAEANNIIDRNVVSTCPRRREALNTIKIYTAKKTNIKYEIPITKTTSKSSMK